MQPRRLHHFLIDFGLIGGTQEIERSRKGLGLIPKQLEQKMLLFPQWSLH